MSEVHDPLLDKVRLIMESPTERSRYHALHSLKEKIEFIRSHFILKDREVRLLERKYLLSTSKTEELMEEVDNIINQME